MWRALIISSAIAATICAATAQEHTRSGSDLIEACRSLANGTAPTSDIRLQVGTCLGELQALHWYAPGVNDPNLRSCIPDGVTRQQMAKSVVAYLDRNSDRLGEPFEGLALEAFAHTWPCAEEPGWLDRWFNKKSGE